MASNGANYGGLADVYGGRLGRSRGSRTRWRTGRRRPPRWWGVASCWRPGSFLRTRYALSGTERRSLRPGARSQRFVSTERRKRSRGGPRKSR
eukprot:1292870-Rhodomonas_salina.2